MLRPSLIILQTCFRQSKLFFIIIILQQNILGQSAKRLDEETTGKSCTFINQTDSDLSCFYLQRPQSELQTHGLRQGVKPTYNSDTKYAKIYDCV